MARQTYLLRRGGAYSARVRVPTDLVDTVGRKELVKGLGTRDPKEAKRLVLAVVGDWHREFDRLRAGKMLAPDQATTIALSHYNAVIDRDEAKRRTIPTDADVQASLANAAQRVQRDGLDTTDPLQALDAALDALVLSDRQQGSESMDTNARSVKLKDLRHHLARGTDALVAHEVDPALRQIDTTAPEGTPERADLVRKLIRAEIEALQRTLERDDGNFGGKPTDSLIKIAAERQKVEAEAGDTVLQAFDQFERENVNGVQQDRLNQMRRDIGLLVDVIGADFPIAKVDKKAVREWKALLIRWPVKATETTIFRGKTMREIVHMNETIKRPTIKDPSVNRYLSSLGALCRWAVNNGYLDTNPVTGMTLAKVTYAKPLPFTVDQMNTLYASPLFAGAEASTPWSKINNPGPVMIRDYRFWVPLIMPFSGARPGEIAQLATADVRQEHGQWIMHITEEGDGDKSVKTGGSMRVVPIHSKLIELGFLNYHAARVKAGDAALFPDAKRNTRGQMIADLSREFPRYLEKLGVRVGRGLSLYSFRHGATDALRRAGYLDEQFGFILGHTSATMTGRYGMLPQGMLQQRVELVEAIAYPGLDLSHLFA